MIIARLVLLAVVLGIALMHHLGGVQHSAAGGCADPGLTTSTMTSSTMPAPAPVVPRHTGTTSGPDLGGMLHLCLAVLAAVVTTYALVALGVLAAPADPRRATLRFTGDGRSRAPPVVRRLAQLQVLRI